MHCKAMCLIKWSWAYIRQYPSNITSIWNSTYLLFENRSNIPHTYAIKVIRKLTEKSLFPVDEDANWIKNISAKIYAVFSYSLICFYNRYY